MEKMSKIACIFVIVMVLANIIMVKSLVNIEYAEAIPDKQVENLITIERVNVKQEEQIKCREITGLKEGLLVGQPEYLTEDMAFVNVLPELDIIKQTARAAVTSRGTGKIKYRKVEPKSRTKKALINSIVTDKDYDSKPIEITGINRDNLERLVMGEAGGEGFEGAALVAQAIRDTMVFEDNYDVLYIKKAYAYSATLDKEPNDDVIKAVEYIFDDGECAVNHRIMYFYAPKWVKGNWSKFHESQKFIVEYKGHKFFDRTW